MKLIKKKIIPFSLIILGGLIQVAYAQEATTLADVANALIPEIHSVAPVLAALSYVAGIMSGIKGALKLKEYNESKGQQVKLTVPIVLIVASAMFLALPTLINTGISTLGFDKGGQQTFKY
jgi:uncharacterized membrane protein (UPF0136 family)